MSGVRPVSLEEDVSRILKDIERIAKKTDIPLYTLIPILSHREFVIINNQLRQIHEMLDYILAELKKR